MIDLHRTTAQNLDFLYLVNLLDADLAFRDGDDHIFYAQYNKVDQIRHCLVAYENSHPVGCGAFRHVDNNTVEIKRMFVEISSRNKGIATKILSGLEGWASEMNYIYCILETGYKQPEAIDFYLKCGYHRIPNYGHYVGVNNSICFSKVI
jgi:putative acetyltransferase